MFLIDSSLIFPYFSWSGGSSASQASLGSQTEKNGINPKVDYLVS